MAFPRQADDNPDATAMRRTYLRVAALEVAIVIALWLFGRMFS